MSALVFRARPGRRRAALSVTPLIDVLFLLIIFFSLTSTFDEAGELELDLPDSSTAEAAVETPEAAPLELIDLPVYVTLRDTPGDAACAQRLTDLLVARAAPYIQPGRPILISAFRQDTMVDAMRAEIGER